LLKDIGHPTPLKVIERGRVAAEDGVLLFQSFPFPDIRNKFHPYVFDRVGIDDFQIEGKEESIIPVIDIVDRTVTSRIDIELRRNGAYLIPEREKDIRKVLYTRRDKKHWGKGFVRGIGADIGGIATTVAHETHGLLVLGFNDADMATAANKVLNMGGGIALVDHDRILHMLPLPQGAIMSDLNISDLARELTRINMTLRERGSKLEDPLWTIVILTLTSIVALRLTVSGVYDVKTGEIVF